MGRETRWTHDGGDLRTPQVLSTWIGRFTPPEGAEAFLSGAPRDRPTFVDSGSMFLPRESEAPLRLPPTLHKPPSLVDLEIPLERPTGRIVQEGAVLAGAEMVMLTNLADMLRSPREFVRRIVTARRTAGYSRLLYAPGIATPSNLVLLAYAGLDLFDDTRVLLEAGWGRLHTEDGFWTNEAAKIACDCAPCLAQEPKPYGHNALSMLRALRTVRASLVAGTLRELAERRAVNDSWSVAVLRHFDLREAEWQEYHAPITGGRTEANAPSSLTRPDILRYRQRIRERYSKPPSTPILLLLPCSARKPYSESRSHKRFREAVRSTERASLVHEVMVTVPLGLVPRELERFHPAASYDLAVTGDWSREESHLLREDLRDFLGRNAYERVIVHLGGEREIVREILGDKAVYTVDDHPTDEVSLKQLAAAVTEAGRDFLPPRWEVRDQEGMRNILRFQFGTAGEALPEDLRTNGRFPHVRIFSGGVQVGTFTDRGLVSLTFAGAERLSRKDAFCIEIEDFSPTGNIFAVGITGATEDIRIGDEVVVRHGRDVRAVGTAVMTPREMVELKRGMAVRVRHNVHRESAPGALPGASD